MRLQSSVKKPQTQTKIRLMLLSFSSLLDASSISALSVCSINSALTSCLLVFDYLHFMKPRTLQVGLSGPPLGPCTWPSSVNNPMLVLFDLFYLISFIFLLKIYLSNKTNFGIESQEMALIRRVWDDLIRWRPVAQAVKEFTQGRTKYREAY